jgi:hypothetical protein
MSRAVTDVPGARPDAGPARPTPGIVTTPPLLHRTSLDTIWLLSDGGLRIRPDALHNRWCAEHSHMLVTRIAAPRIVDSCTELCTGRHRQRRRFLCRAIRNSYHTTEPRTRGAKARKGRLRTTLRFAFFAALGWLFWTNGIQHRTNQRTSVHSVLQSAHAYSVPRVLRRTLKFTSCSLCSCYS